MSNAGDTTIDYTQYINDVTDTPTSGHELQWSNPVIEYNNNNVPINAHLIIKERIPMSPSGYTIKYSYLRIYAENGLFIWRNNNNGYCTVYARTETGVLQYTTATESNYYNGSDEFTACLSSKKEWTTATSMTWEFYREQYVISLDIDAPIFPVNNMPENYWDTGNTDGSIDIKKSQLNFTVTVQPTFDGVITVTWNVPDDLLKQMQYVNIYVSPGDESVNKVLLAGKINYKTGKYLTSYYDCSQKLGAGYIGTFTMFINAEYNDASVTPLMYARLEKGKKPMFWGAGELTEPIYTDICTITVKIAGKGNKPDAIKPPADNNPTDPDAETDIDDNKIMERGANLATTYKITEQQLKQIGEKLWSFSITDIRLNLSSAPIENIVSIKLMPIAQSSSQVSQILVGNMDTGVTGNIVNTINPRVIGTVDVPGYYNNFLDYEPYTQCSIYLPFAGFKSLQSNYIIGHAVSVKYTYDVVTGSCKIAILSDNKTFAEFDAQCGIDLPLTSSNRAQIESAQLTSFVGAVTTGNIMPLLDTAIKTPTYNSTGSSNSTCAAQMRLKCFITVDRPVADLPYSFPHDVGVYCGITCQIGKLSGFTMCNPNVDLSGIPCLAAERDMLLDILTSGFYA